MDNPIQSNQPAWEIEVLWTPSEGPRGPGADLVTLGGEYVMRWKSDADWIFS